MTHVVAILDSIVDSSRPIFQGRIHNFWEKVGANMKVIGTRPCMYYIMYLQCKVDTLGLCRQNAGDLRAKLEQRFYIAGIQTERTRATARSV